MMLFVARAVTSPAISALVYRSTAVARRSVRTLIVGAYQPEAADDGRMEGTTLGARSRMVKRRVRRNRAGDRKPSIQVARNMPMSTTEMDNASLVALGAMGHYAARQEIVVRDIMAKDAVPYEKAREIFKGIEKTNQEYMFLVSLPYKIGIGTALTAGIVSFPLVFDLTTAEWFNEHYVTTDVPEPKDLETGLEVGAWTWNWMEPPLGQISFFLLCLQFSRAQIENLGMKPYTGMVKRWRGERLALTYPKYDARALIAYSESAPLVGTKTD